jgi:hypothetical protein
VGIRPRNVTTAVERGSGRFAPRTRGIPKPVLSLVGGTFQRPS